MLRRTVTDPLEQLGILFKDELNTRLGKRKNRDNLVTNKEDILESSLEELKELANEMSKELGKEVFDEKSRRTIECTRNVLDLETIAIQIKSSGAAHISAIRGENFITSSRVLVPSM